jgi:hypothetical protein
MSGSCTVRLADENVKVRTGDSRLPSQVLQSKDGWERESGENTRPTGPRNFASSCWSLKGDLHAEVGFLVLALAYLLIPTLANALTVDGKRVDRIPGLLSHSGDA